MNPICPYCFKPAELVGGSTIYPHRPDLFGLKFWNCSACDAYVGCHKKGAWITERKQHSDGTLPLGRLANAELRRVKGWAHDAFDPLWRNGIMSRRDAYAWLAGRLGIQTQDCHIGMFDVAQCRSVIAAVNSRGQP